MSQSAHRKGGKGQGGKGQGGKGQGGKGQGGKGQGGKAQGVQPQGDSARGGTDQGLHVLEGTVKSAPVDITALGSLKTTTPTHTAPTHTAPTQTAPTQTAPTQTAPQRARAPKRAVQRLTLAACALFLVGLAHAHRPTVAESPEARVARRFQAQVASGPALNLTLESQEGEQSGLERFRGQVVLVNFWASWCPPCLKEMPDLEGLARDMEGRPFSLVALSGDDSWDAINGVLGAQDLKMQVFRDPNLKEKQHLRYGTEKLPETYVIDKQGNLRLRFINVQPWQSEEIVSYLQWLTNE